MCYDSTLQERRTAWRQTSSSTPPPPPRGLTPDRPPLGSPTGPRRDATRSSREWPTNPALAVCIPHSTNAVCTTRENGIQQPPTAVLAEDWIGFDPHRQRIDHTAPAHVSYAAPTTSSPRHTSEGASSFSVFIASGQSVARNCFFVAGHRWQEGADSHVH